MSMSDDDFDFLAAALPAFISEAREQVSQIEHLLLELEDAPSDRERLNALFRCAHTVKGSAGLFGLEQVVDFTHHIETLLDQLREGHLQLTAALSSLLLACSDQVLALVNQAAGEATDDGEKRALRVALVQQLQAALVSAEAPPSTDERVASPSGVGAEPAARPGRWVLAVRFGRDCLRNGMDPLNVLRYLASRADILQVHSERSAIPTLESLEPESCYLNCTITLRSEQPQAAIDDAFSFIREDCELQLTPPELGLQRTLDQLETLPDHPRLGELLVGGHGCYSSIFVITTLLEYSQATLARRVFNMLHSRECHLILLANAHQVPQCEILSDKIEGLRFAPFSPPLILRILHFYGFTE